MPTHRKKPLEIDALPAKEVWDKGSQGKWDELPSWVKSAADKKHVVLADFGLVVRTNEGTMRAQPEWWLIRGIHGELYPCDPDVFAESYEEV